MHKAIEARGFKGDGAIADITRALTKAGYSYSPQHVGAVLNTGKKPINDKFVKALMKGLNIPESEISPVDSKIYQSGHDKPIKYDNSKHTEDSETPAPMTGDNQELFTFLRPDQKKMLLVWEKLDCEQRIALMSLAKLFIRG